MKKLLTISAFQLFSISAFILNAETIDWSEAANHIGKEATVTGTIKHVNSLPSGMTFMNFADRGASPNFTIVSKTGTAQADQLKLFQGKHISITGNIETYKNSPQIVLKSLEDLRIVESNTPGNDPRPAPEPSTQPIPETTNNPSAISIFDITLERKEIRDAGKSPSGIAPEIANVCTYFPPNFKSSPDTTAILVFPDFLTDKDLEKLITPYIPTANARGWPIIAARGPVLDYKLPPAWHSTMFLAAFRHLKKDHPDIHNWSFFLSGIADSSYRATQAAPFLIADDINIKGCLLISLMTADFGKSIKLTRLNDSKYREVRIFVAHGNDNDKHPRADSLAQTQIIRNLGFKFVKHDGFKGVTRPPAETFQTAFDWLASEQP